MEKKIIDWKAMTQKIFRSLQLYLLLIFVLTMTIGTYGIYVLKNNQVPFKQVATTLPIMEEKENSSDTAAKIMIESVETMPSVAKSIPDTFIASSLESEEEIKDFQETERKRIDPMQVTQLALPCTGVIVRNFGFSFDPVYEDYRYYDGVNYLLEDDTSVYAVDSGIVDSVNETLEEGFELTLVHENFVTIYRNLTNITVQNGQVIEKGEIIGTVDTPQKVLYFAVEEK